MYKSLRYVDDLGSEMQHVRKDKTAQTTEQTVNAKDPILVIFSLIAFNLVSHSLRV